MQTIAAVEPGNRIAELCTALVEAVKGNDQ